MLLAATDSFEATGRFEKAEAFWTGTETESVVDRVMPMTSTELVVGTHSAAAFGPAERWVVELTVAPLCGKGKSSRSEVRTTIPLNF